MTTRPADQTDTPTTRDRKRSPVPLLLRSVGLKSFWDQRRSILWWFSGAAILSAIIIMLFPSISSGAEMEALLERLPPAAQAMMGENIELTTPSGYLNLRLFTVVGPIIFLIYGIGHGAGAISGEEQRGTMDLLIANPIRRWRIVVEKFITMVAGMIIIGVALWLGIVVGAAVVDVDLNVSHAAQATVMVVLFGIFYGSLALAIGGWTGRYALAIGVSAATTIAAYFLHTLAPLVDWLEPFQKLSPFYYYIDAAPMMNGMNPDHALVLAALSLGLLGLGVFAFQRRDIQV